VTWATVAWASRADTASSEPSTETFVAGFAVPAPADRLLIRGISRLPGRSRMISLLTGQIQP
jgi:hypothetical protein